MYARKQWKVLIILSAMFFVWIFVPGCKSEYRNLDLSMYQYRDTKELVRFVYDAALIVKKNGMKSLDYFRKNRNLFNNNGHYLYIYDMNGTNLYSAGMKSMEGRNLRDITDKDGKKITQLVLNALNDKNNPHAWVHYSWWEPGKFYPVPKSSCHFKVKTPDGKELFVGGGMDYPHEEKEFIRIVVDDAADLIRQKGRRAFAEISDPASEYNYRDVRVFAFRPDGKILISPVVDNNFLQIKLLECTDEVGHKPFAKVLKKLKFKSTAWEVFMAKNRYQRMPVKKCLYVRKTVLNGNEIYVAAITNLPQPPY